MFKKKILPGILVCAGALLIAALFTVSLGESASAQQAFTPVEELGKFIFFDENLSEPAGQSCASCHHPAAGFAEPDQTLPVSEGVIPGRFGNRNSPSAAYAAFTPVFDARKTLGGQFWDGRAPDLVEQAKGPFLNPVEMNNPDKAAVIGKIAVSQYADLFEQVFGPDAFADVEAAYHNMATAIAAYESTVEVNKFTSKFDAYQAGLVELTPQEALGEKLFNGSAKCHHCHPTKTSGGDPILFTDFDYHNLGLPQNTEYPFNLQNPIPIDLGLGAITMEPRDNGKFKTPHLRNIVLTSPYMHNGLLKTLKEVVNFYNTRDVPGMWDPPEVPQNLDSKFLGDLGLTDAEENAIVVFMETFTDGYMIPYANPGKK
ncbi:MAG: cytochrome-c peroxidase [Candidatus Aminicenantes bacterium]|nr:MAG: cytochrome-c peroxidase [Candidatus Aminicenantes bacterium]